MVEDGADGWAPALELGHPVGQRAEGAQYEERPRHALRHQVRQEADRLHLHTMRDISPAYRPPSYADALSAFLLWKCNLAELWCGYLRSRI